VLIRAFYSMLRRVDQAHLTRDFTDTIGVPPAQYAASVSAGG
jgi:hypothetical protein